MDAADHLNDKGPAGRGFWLEPARPFSRTGAVVLSAGPIVMKILQPENNLRKIHFFVVLLLTPYKVARPLIFWLYA